MAPRRLALSDRLVRQIPAPARGRSTYHDEAVPALSVVVSATGSRSWWFTKRAKDGTLIRLSLGDAWLPVADARNLAHGWLLQIAKGANPMADLRAAKQAAAARRNDEAKRRALTVGVAWDAWVRLHAEPHLRPATVISVRSIWKLYLSPLATRPLDDVTAQEATELHARIGSAVGTVTANHVVAYARAIWRWAARHLAYAGPIPWAAVRRFHTEPRTRAITDAELPAFLAAVRAAPRDFHDYCMILLGTGARRRNVERMRWTDIDLSQRTWTIRGRDAKGKRPVVVPLCAAVTDILQRRHRPGAVWVFESPRRPGQPIADWRRAWRKVVEAANCPGLHAHDLRRTFGAMLVRSGVPMRAVGELLGHRDATMVARVYSPLTTDQIRAPVELIGRHLTPPASPAQPPAQPAEDEPCPPLT